MGWTSSVQRCNARFRRAWRTVSPYITWWSITVLAAIIGAGVAISIVTYNATSSSEDDDLAVSFRQAAKDTSDSIGAQLQRTLSSISNLRMVTGVKPNFTLTDWDLAVDLLVRPSVVASLGWMPQVADLARPALEARIRRDSGHLSPLYTNFTVRTYNYTSKVLYAPPFGVSEYYYPALYLWPRPNYSPNSLVGYDIKNSPELFGNIPQCINTGEPTLLTGVRLLSDPRSRGIIFYVPFFNSFPAPKTSAARLADASGVMGASAQLTNLIDSARPPSANNVLIVLFDMSSSPPSLLYSDLVNVTKISDVQPVDGMMYVQKVAAADRSWQFIAIPSQTFVSSSLTNRPKLFAGLVALAFALLLVLAMFSIRQIVRSRIQSERSDRKRRFLSEMVGYVNHELRNPLHAIVGLNAHATEASMACLRSVQPSKDVLRAIYSDLRDTGNMCDLMVHICNDVLDIRKLEEGKLQVNHEPVSLKRVLADVIAIVQPKLSEKASLTLTLEPFDESLTFMSDIARVKQVLLNFVTNAIKYSDSGEIRVRAKVVVSDGTRSHLSDRSGLTSVQPGLGALASNPDQRCLRFEVQDTGRGVEEEKKGLLFKPFSQIEGGPRHQGSGSGLGLYLCLMLVELMGGHIDYVSTFGVGSTFWFEIPLISPPEGCVDADDQVTSFVSLAVDSTGAQNAADAVEGTWRDGKCGVTSSHADHNGIDIELVEVSQESDTSSEEHAAAMHARESTRVECIALQDVGGADGCVESAAMRNDKVPEAPATARMRHLVCDDGRINRLVLRRYLEALGPCSVDEAENGQQAVDMAAAAQNVRGAPYDIVWMDVRMPVLDGIEATKRIRANPDCRKTLIFGVTGDVTAQEITLYRGIGMHDILSKPVTRAVIADKLSRLERPVA
eukprot:Opistho-1_new@90823